MVVVDQAHNVAERIEPGVKRGVIASQAAVHNQAGQPLSDRNVEQLRVIEACHRHMPFSLPTHFPQNNVATLRCSRRTSENTLKAKFRELPF